MRPRRILDDQAQINQAVADLLGRFEYPEPGQIQFDAPLGGGGGMLTVSVAGASLGPEITEKADVVIDDLNPADASLQNIIDTVEGLGGGTIWMNAFLELATGITIPSGVTLRGLSPASTGFIGPTSGAPALITVGVGAELKDLSLAFDVRIAVGGGHVDNLWIFGSDAGANAIINITDGGSRVTNILSSGSDGALGIVHIGATSNAFVDHVYAVNNSTGPVVGATDAAYCVISHLLDISSSQLVDLDGAYAVTLASMVGLAEGTSSPATGAINILDSEIVTVDGAILDQVVHGVRCQNSRRIDIGSTVHVNLASRHGIWLVDSNDCTVKGRVRCSSQETHNTWDNVILEGSCNKNFLTGMHLSPLGSAQARFPRYGVNVAGDCNRVVGNVFGYPGEYGTDAYNDGGTNTQNVWPNDVVYGDNFTNCGES